MSPSRPPPLCSRACVAVVFVLATIYFLTALRGTRRERQNERARFALVHIPKTGGQAFRLLARHACDNAIAVEAKAHSTVESHVLARGQEPILILREPLERLASAFYFWKHGSELRSMRQLRGPQATVLMQDLQRTPMSFRDFLVGYVNSTSPWHGRVHAIINMPRHLSGWAWSAHFRSQMEWIDLESPRSSFVCYSDRHYSARLGCLMRELNLNCNLSSLRTVNRHLGGGASSHEKLQQLPHALQRAVLLKLHADYKLFQRYCGTCTPECTC
uniref:Sulfotransferase domain-containing protein n=1 Tax=Calcidiscus leptoporus TaxID=127549 RepID=A0A7S0NQF8_9EUKA|mmetsp:Transcript_15846/g.36254  ORF Transcript_15846/g.36254 Transcript_15846/m.36254 type:complete len:273 (+) Transcript_15846:270-1088(+)